MPDNPTKLEAIVSLQIKREARDIISAAKICKYGLPQVVVTAPLLRGKPHPSVLWLTCPELDKCVGRIEGSGGISEINEIIKKDPELLKELLDDQNEFIGYRLSLLDVVLGDGSGRAALREDFMRSLSSAGIDGTSELFRVKCLHSYLAHHLGLKETFVGRFIEDKIPADYCARPCVDILVSDIIATSDSIDPIE